jgi:hypothetical protein
MSASPVNPELMALMVSVVLIGNIRFNFVDDSKLAHPTTVAFIFLRQERVILRRSLSKI